MACDRIWASVDDTDGSRYDVPRAALTMLHLHGDLFRGDMLERPIGMSPGYSSGAFHRMAEPQ